MKFRIRSCFKNTLFSKGFGFLKKETVDSVGLIGYSLRNFGYRL
ncbi:hypothetical protein LEP1GSC008_1973 [Leptospira kirschneri serovar Bulgarica str. Nikolaevo]|uniref:Uncharacterized protein n=1 Tax=Leptospira kirschneri serovar Bulgarica str. Nikolaevo TaxID=1240687 RepID=M6EZ85_9LEPT|nr:hypothetical protein LEP1GSC122_1641 [Leptospira kirschneri serovar Valbuzzi str. 200702274]EMK20172.1 hypothetical protein LEP1GSC008_1973 [Leptospira kirschneri serovar Bulgarica str. Nikolaevo]